jgi:hypothetical protein
VEEPDEEDPRYREDLSQTPEWLKKKKGCRQLHVRRHRAPRERHGRHKPRALRRLYDKRGPLMKALTREYFKYNKVKMLDPLRTLG